MEPLTSVNRNIVDDLLGKISEFTMVKNKNITLLMLQLCTTSDLQPLLQILLF